MKKALPFIAVAVISVFVTATSIALYPTNTEKTQAAASFDHSNCQYPYRWSNPENGCDNSDPAVPECIKGMSTQAEEKACIDAFVAQHNQAQPTTPVTPVTPPVVTTPAPAPSTCK
jgi:hypothetical protein